MTLVGAVTCVTFVGAMGGGGGPSKTSSNDFSCALQKACFLVCIIILRINKTGGLRVMGTSMCGTGEGLGLPPSRKHLLRLANIIIINNNN